MTAKLNSDLLGEVEKVLDTLRPFLQADGGDVEIVELTKDMVVKVKLLGNCEDCSMSLSTMKAGLQEAVRQALPQIKSVEAVG